VVTIVAFLLQGELVVRLFQVLLFAVVATLAGKRIRWGYFLIMVGSITFFNLLTPVGRVLAELGPIRVTEGALEQGLMKGLAIVGLVFISLFAVRPDLRLPGTFGGILARLFFYFERILDTRKRVSAKRLVESVDGVLLELYPPEAKEGWSGSGGIDGQARESDAESARTDALGAMLLVSIVVANAVLAIVY
jgi:heptaprenyl diphosphate synthase